MISVTDLRSGTTFEDNGQIFQVISYEHIKMGRGSGTIKVKIKNLRSNSTTEKSFITGAKVQNIDLIKKKYQYLYKDSSGAFFMDSQTFGQIQIPLTKMAGEVDFLKEGLEVTISFYNDEPLSLDLPIKMEFTVSDTEVGIKGNSQTNIFKDATLGNGMRVKVPLFIKIGNTIRIDTRTGTYVERVS